jgi:hypothetical protein
MIQVVTGNKGMRLERAIWKHIPKKIHQCSIQIMHSHSHSHIQFGPFDFELTLGLTFSMLVHDQSNMWENCGDLKAILGLFLENSTCSTIHFIFIITYYKVR